MLGVSGQILSPPPPKALIRDSLRRLLQGADGKSAAGAAGLAGGMPFPSFTLERRQPVITIELGDEVQADFLRANRFARPRDRATAKAFGVHLAHHIQGAAVLFGLALREQVQVR